MIKLFLCGLVQMFLAASNVGIIAEKRAMVAMVTSFILALTWGIIIQEFVRGMTGYIAVVSYAAGASVGTGVGVYLNREGFMKTFFKKKHTKGVAMAEKQEKKPVERKTGDAKNEEVKPNPETQAKGKKIKDEINELMDEIDGVLEENSEEFVKNYVQKGGE